MKKIIKKIYNTIILKIKYKNKNIKIQSFNISKDIKLGQNCSIGKHVVISKNVDIGDYTYLNSEYNWTIIDSNVIIGKFCSIGPGVTIGLGNHNFKYISTHPFLYSKDYSFVNRNIKKVDDTAKTIIGNDVWIGSYSNIKRGVKIGDGAIIGMNAVVTKDIPPYAIVGGVPAKIIRYRFKNNEIKLLEENKWWNQTNTMIKENICKMYNIDDYISCLNESKLSDYNIK